MGAEILSLFGVVLAAVLADLLVPTENGGMRQFLHFLTAMVLLVLLLRPFLSVLGGTESILRGDVQWPQGEENAEEYERIFRQTVTDRSAAELREGLFDMLYREYGIAEENCEIRVQLTKEGELSEISIFLSGSALLHDPEEIECDLREKFECTVEVR